MMDRQLKQRVVGAGLLVAFGVIFIPIFLDNGGVESPVPPSMNIPPAPTEDVSQRAPALGEGAVAEMETQADEEVEAPPSRVQNGEGNSAESSPSTTPSASGEPPAAVETQEEGAAVDGAAPAEQNDAGSEPTTPPRMQPPEPRVVSKPATVAPAVSEARPLGHTEAEPHAKPKPPEGKAMAKPVETKAPLKGSDTKLPPKTAEAKSVEAKTVPKPGDGKAVAKVSEAKSALKSAESKTDEPKSTPAATDARTPSTAPKPPVPVVGGWNVQLGSFASDINAKNLVDKLKAAGYKAYSEPRLEQGVTVFKVRVGPTPGKAEAERIRQRIEGQFDAHGMLVPSH